MHRLTTRAAIMLLIATFATGCDASRGDLAQSFTRAGARANSSTAVAGAAGAPGAPGASTSSTTHVGSGELPETWPGDVVMPAGSHVGATTSIVTGDVTVLGVSGSSPLPSHVVREHFDQQFADWEPGDERWRDGVATWRRGLMRARVVVGSIDPTTTGFTVRLD